jgi:hypothetical protein
MIPLQRQDIHRIRHLFGAGHVTLATGAVIADTSPARVWADDLAAPRAAGWRGADRRGHRPALLRHRTRGGAADTLDGSVPC